MTTGLNYASYVTQMATLIVVAEDDVNFQKILPQMITYAENRMCRDLDFLSTTGSINNLQLTVGSRKLTIPEGTFVVTENFNIITPAGTTDPDQGTIVPCLPVTKEFLDAVYGSAAVVGVPVYYAPLDDNVFLFGPFPDAAYNVQIIGTVRPESLSVSNPETFISLYLPDVMIMASMIYAAMYQRNFGKVSDDPAMAMTYEQQYQALLKSALIEEVRKKYESSGWTSQSPSPTASPSRG